MIAEHINVHVAARAPPFVATNVAIAGAAFSEHGNGIVLHEYETQFANLGFGVVLDATNKGRDCFLDSKTASGGSVYHGNNCTVIGDDAATVNHFNKQEMDTM